MQRLIEIARDRILRHADAARVETPIPRLSIGVLRQCSVPMMNLCDPMVCVVLQGEKEVIVGNRLLRYDPTLLFATSLGIVATGRILRATTDEPYIAASLDIDQELLGELVGELGATAGGERPAAFGLAQVTEPFLEAFGHLLALLDYPKHIDHLAATREREVLYWLLQTGHGSMLRQMARRDDALAKVRRSIEWIREHYNTTLRVAFLAEVAGMSVPAFHRHFKASTALSPLQFQKTLRLQSARRLLTVHGNASHAAYSVGYESASQFIREYSRLFGITPAKDAARFRLTIVKPPVIV